MYLFVVDVGSEEGREIGVYLFVVDVHICDVIIEDGWYVVLWHFIFSEDIK